jgi:hypothetical protein
MTAVSEIMRSEGKRVGAATKASVVRAGAKYRSEQGSDYEPGVSAETVDSKVLFLGVVPSLQGREPGHMCTSGMRPRSTCSTANLSFGPGISCSIARSYGRGTTSSFPKTCCMLPLTGARKPRCASARATNPPLKKASCFIPRWTPGYRDGCSALQLALSTPVERLGGSLLRRRSRPS